MKHTLLRNFSLLARSAKDRLRFPRQRPGLSYALNWQLAKYYVTPLHSALLNSVSGARADLKSQEIEIVDMDPYFKENAFQLIGSNISRAEQVYAERGYLGEKPVCFITREKQVAEAVRSKLGSESHEDQNAVGIIYASEVRKFGDAAIVDEEKKLVGLTALNWSQVEKIVKDL